MGPDEDDFVVAPDGDGSRRRWFVAAAVIALIALVALGMGAWALARRSGESSVAPSKPPAIEPAQVTTAAETPETSPTASVTPTAEAEVPTKTASGSGGTTGSAGSAATIPTRPPYMAFRLAGTVYLAREDGAKALPLVATDGVFALSPDARALAYVDPVKGQLAIADLSTQTTRTVGPASQITPRWAPDSSWVLGVQDATGGQGAQAFRADRSTGVATVLGSGSRAAVSPDGKVVALVPVSAGRGADALVLLKDGRPWKMIKAPGPILDAVVGDGEVYVATTRAAQDANAQGVWALPFYGSSRLLSGVPSGAEPGDFGMLALSDSGKHLAYARIGDDGRSRASIVPVSGGTPAQIAVRRDVYPLWWAANSSALFAIEGNSWQGEQTALVRFAPDGHREAVVVKGADR